MSRIIVYLLDKTVWLLLITVLTTQALQIAGIVETPKSAGDIAIHDSTNNLDLTHDNTFRIKRDTSESTERSQFLDTLFNIPIKTLTAVNNLIQNSRPALRKLREFAAKRFEKTTKAPDVSTNTVQKRSYPVFIRPATENK